MKIRLWTLQHVKAYEKMLETGTLRADERHLFCEDDFRQAYDWMAAELRSRIGKAPEGVTYPVWAWAQWEGKQKRMDLRRSGYAKRGTPMVQIEFEADMDSVLLSDFDGWHHVLGKTYIADNEDDFNRFWELPEQVQEQEAQASWRKIFDLNRSHQGWESPQDEKSIQAVLWEIKVSQIIKIEHFIAK